MNKLPALISAIILIILQSAAFAQTPIIETVRTSGWNPDGSAIFVNASEFSTSNYTWDWYKSPNTFLQTGGDTLPNQNVGEYQIVLHDLNGGDSTGYNIYFHIGMECTVYGYPNIDSAIIVNAIPGSAIGYIQPLLQGGNGGYTWNWSNGSTQMFQSALTPGSYTAIVTDASYCSDTATYDILIDSNGVSPFAPNLYFSYTEPWASYANVMVNPTGGIPPYETIFSNGSDIFGYGGSGYDYVGNWSGLQYATCFDSGGDTAVVNFIISGEETTFGNVPYPDSMTINNFYCGIIENCDIDYQNVDSAHVYAIVYDSSAQQLDITWAVYSSTNTFYLYDTIPFSGDPGLYTINVSAYCPGKSSGNYLTILEQVHLNGQFELASIDENTLEGIVLAPNPFSDRINIYGLEGIYEIQTTDVFGREIAIELINEGKYLQIVFEDRELASGTYYIRLSNSNGSKSFKLIH